MKIRNSIAGVLALWLGAEAACAQSVDDLALRQKLVREEFTPAFEQAMRPPLERSWDQFPADLVDPEELAAARQAHTREIDVMIELFSARAAEVVVRRVPVAEMGSGADLNSPIWQATLQELATLQRDVEREALELVARVIKAGCTVKPQPSQGCVSMLAMLPSIQSGRILQADGKTK